MRKLLVYILCLYTSLIYGQYNFTQNYKEKITKLYYNVQDTQQINVINVYDPLVDYRYYKSLYCYYAFIGDLKNFEDKTKDKCNTLDLKRTNEIAENLKTKVNQLLSKFVIIKQPKLSNSDSIIVANELLKIKLSFASFDKQYKDVDLNISDELYNVLQQFPAQEHLFIDSFSFNNKDVFEATDKGMLKCIIINLKERKIKYYKMVWFGLELTTDSPTNRTIRRVLKPYISHLKKVNGKNN